jgi:hypothetical protein
MVTGLRAAHSAFGGAARATRHQLIRYPLRVSAKIAGGGELANRWDVPVTVIRGVRKLELVSLSVVLKARELAIMQRAFSRGLCYLDDSINRIAIIARWP